MTGEFKQELRDGFIEACLHLVNRDFSALATDFVTLGYLCLFLFHFKLSNLTFSMLKDLPACNFIRLLPPTAEKEAVTQALTGYYFIVFRSILKYCFWNTCSNFIVRNICCS